MQKWIDVNDRLPLSGIGDDRYDAPFHEDEVYVLIDGEEKEAVFWACLDYSLTCGDVFNPNDFLMEFDEDNVTHWRFK